MSQAPDNDPSWYDRPNPAPRCSVPGCEHPSYLVNLWTGRRCQHHPATYSAAAAALLEADQRPDTAAAYRRLFGVLP